MDSVYDTAVELQDRVPEALLLFQGVPPTVGVNIATAERPPPEELIDEHYSRMEHQ